MEAVAKVPVNWRHVAAFAAVCLLMWMLFLWCSMWRRLRYGDLDDDLDFERQPPAAETVIQIENPKPRKNPISSLPTALDYEPPSAGGSPETCTVCTEDLAAGEQVRRLPRCSHVFHRDCIDGWLMLALAPTCPLCRSDVEEDC